tara:strand:- start:3872 stop:4102 length:231 start_codon:yes stop_codon:yes gene_type:complete
MIFELFSKRHSESIDRIDLANMGVQGARTYFMGRKQLSEEEFDKVFEVKASPHKRAWVGKYDWWKEESKNLDIERE